MAAKRHHPCSEISGTGEPLTSRTPDGPSGKSQNVHQAGGPKLAPPTLSLANVRVCPPGSTKEGAPLRRTRGGRSGAPGGVGGVGRGPSGGEVFFEPRQDGRVGRPGAAPATCLTVGFDSVGIRCGGSRGREVTGWRAGSHHPTEHLNPLSPLFQPQKPDSCSGCHLRHRR